MTLDQALDLLVVQKAENARLRELITLLDERTQYTAKEYDKLKKLKSQLSESVTKGEAVTVIAKSLDGKCIIEAKGEAGE